MKLKLDDVEKMLSIIFKKYKESRGNEIDMENDYYWHFNENEIYDMNDEPNDFSIGQLSEDLQILNNSLNSGDLIPYDLQRIANIITALSIEKPIWQVSL